MIRVSALSLSKRLGLREYFLSFASDKTVVFLELEQVTLKQYFNALCEIASKW